MKQILSFVLAAAMTACASVPSQQASAPTKDSEGTVAVSPEQFYLLCALVTAAQAARGNYVLDACLQ